MPVASLGSHESVDTASAAYVYARSDWGASATDRVIVVGGSYRGAGTVTLTSVVIGGVNGDVVVQATNASSGNTTLCFIAKAALPNDPSGGQADIEVNFSANMARGGVGVWRATGIDFAAAYSTATDNSGGEGTVQSATMDLAPGIQVACAFLDPSTANPPRHTGASRNVSAAELASTVSCSVSGTNSAWTGPTEDYDAAVSASSLNIPQCMVAAAWANAPASGAPDYGEVRKPRTVILPDGRVVRPRTQQEYWRLVSEALIVEAPKEVAISRKSVKRRKSSKIVGAEPELKTDYRLTDRAIEALRQSIDEAGRLQLSIAMAALSSSAAFVMRVADEAVLFTILSEV